MSADIIQALDLQGRVEDMLADKLSESRYFLVSTVGKLMTLGLILSSSNDTISYFQCRAQPNFEAAFIATTVVISILTVAFPKFTLSDHNYQRAIIAHYLIDVAHISQAIIMLYLLIFNTLFILSLATTTLFKFVPPLWFVLNKWDDLNFESICKTSISRLVVLELMTCFLFMILVSAFIVDEHVSNVGLSLTNTYSADFSFHLEYVLSGIHGSYEGNSTISLNGQFDLILVRNLSCNSFIRFNGGLNSNRFSAIAKDDLTRLSSGCPHSSVTNVTIVTDKTLICTLQGNIINNHIDCLNLRAVTEANYSGTLGDIVEGFISNCTVIYQSTKH